jgi:hypothetical protein
MARTTNSAGFVKDNIAKEMTRPWRFFFAFASFGVGGFAMAAPPLPAIPTAAIPTVQCIHHVLKSSSAVQLVSLYSIDNVRFAAEYVFRNKDDRAVVSDIEFFVREDSVTETDLIPREVSMATAAEAQDLETKLDLVSKCHLNVSLDNLLPQPKARAEWQKIEWPSD